jgi:hypothetical protein
MSKQKDQAKVKFLDNLFDKAEQPLESNYILMGGKKAQKFEENNNKSKKIPIGYFILILLFISSLIYFVYSSQNPYTGTLRSIILLLFVILLIGLTIDYFYLRRYKELYSKVEVNLNGKNKKKNDDIEYDDNYHLMDI